MTSDSSSDKHSKAESSDAATVDKYDTLEDRKLLRKLDLRYVVNNYGIFTRLTIV
jgi:hypothetical protein